MPSESDTPSVTNPSYRQCVQMLRRVAKERSEWAGIPMLLNDYDLILEPRFPYQLKRCRDSDVNEAVEDEELINSWWSDKLMAVVLVTRRNGKLFHYVDYSDSRGGRKCRQWIDNLMCSDVWMIEAEIKAVCKLKEMVTDRAFQSYLLTGSFLESSKRSRVHYMFRRLRPTLAISDSTGEARILCALCLHSIGYYRGTHCGVMVPTDEIISHLVWMRGDEKKFWAQSTQHPPNHPMAGL